MTAGKKPRILIIEDDADLRKILRLQLSDAGFEIDEAGNGAIGFAMVQRQRPDCVILDLMMPVLDGFGFLKRIRCLSGFQNIPILVLTASEDERHRTRGFLYQADAYMSKPYDTEELLTTISNLCSATQPIT